MSIQWPQTVVSHNVLAYLPPHQTPSPPLKRACKRYVTAMNELNKQICDYNAEALQRQLSVCRTLAEMRQLLLQVMQVPFASVNVHTVSAHMPRLIVLDRAAQCVNLLREVLDEWEMDGTSAASASDGDPNTAAAATEIPISESFSVFSSWSPIQAASLV